MRTLATELLKRAHLPLADVDMLAADLSTVHFEERIDHAWNANESVEELFLRRIGGIGALVRYLECIRPREDRTRTKFQERKYLRG